MTRVLQPQRDIERERETQREKEGEGEREREKEGERERRKFLHEARYHDAANDMCYFILLW